MQIQVLSILALLSIPAMANPPGWWREENTVTQRGHMLTLLCKGQGTAKDLSYRAAITSCRSMAATHLKDASFRVQSLVIETETQAAYHAEEAANLEIVGLKAEVTKEFTEQLPSGEFVTYLRYQADTSQAKVKNIEDRPKEVFGSILQEEKRNAANPSQEAPKPIVHGEDRLIILSILPSPCDSILVRGARPRVIKCQESPVSLVLHKKDREILIRRRGYKTKKLTVNLDNSPEETSVQEVLLEKF